MDLDCLPQSMSDASTDSETGTSDAAATALVLGGGGARAAYQTGVLEYVGEAFPRASVPLMTGVSAGSINAAHLAADPGPWAHRTMRLTNYWEDLTMDDVFAPRSLWTMGTSLLRGTPSPKQVQQPLWHPNPPFVAEGAIEAETQAISSASAVSSK